MPRNFSSGVPCRALKTLALMLLTTTGVAPDAVTAQQAELIGPGDERVRAEIVRPFRATYRQMGTPFWFELRRTPNDRPQYSVAMTMHTTGGSIGIDHAGIWADDLSFAYRRFGYGAFGAEYLHVEESDGVVTMLRMATDPHGYAQRKSHRERLDSPVFEGTVAYWLLAALPLAEGAHFRLPTLLWTEEGFDRHEAEFRVVGRERVTALDGGTYDCWVVTSGNERVTLSTYVADRAPYLIKQTATQGDRTDTVIELHALQEAS